MGIAIKKTHTKFEDLIFKIGKVPAILRFNQFYKENWLKMAIFSHIFFVLAIKFHRMNLFQNCFHRWSTFWPYFPMTPIKVNIMAIIGVSHNTHYGKNGHYGCYGSTNYGCKFDLYGCSWKICSKCRSPVKMVSKKIHLTEFYGQNN